MNNNYNSGASNQTSILVPLLVGLLFTIIPISLLKSDIDMRNSKDSKTYSTRVTHKKNRTSYDGKTQITYTPTYYYNVNGQEYSCSTGDSSSFRSKASKQIYYEANAPQSCYVEEGFAKYLYYGLMFIMGACCILFCKKFKQD